VDNFALDHGGSGRGALNYSAGEGFTLDQRRSDAVSLRLRAAVVLDRLKDEVIEELAECPLHGRAGEARLFR